MAKRKREQTPEAEVLEKEEEFEINVIDRVRCVAGEETGSAWEYHVRWCGYPNPDDDTWEPHEGLVKTVPVLLERLWREIDPNDEDRDYKIGDELAPSDEWIRQEIEESAERWKEITRERTWKEKKKAMKNEAKEAKRKVAKKKKRVKDSDGEEDDDSDVAFVVTKEEGLLKDDERLRSQKKNRRGAFDATRNLADELNGALSASDVGEASDGDSDAPLASQVPKLANGPRIIKKKYNPYTLEPKAGSSRAPTKNTGTKRKVTGGRETTMDSEDERPTTKIKKRRTLEPSPVTSSARASPAGSAEPVSAKAKGKARASVVSPPAPETQARAPVRSKAASPRPVTPPPASDADDASLFGSSPQKAQSESASAPATGATRATTSIVVQDMGAGSTAAEASASSRTKPPRTVQMMDAPYSDGSALDTKAAALRKPNPMAKAGFPQMKKPLNQLRTGSKRGTLSGPPVIPQGQGPRSATGTPRIAQRSPVIPQQHMPAMPQHSPTGASMSPPAYMDVDGPMWASPVNMNAEEFIMDAIRQPPAPAPSTHPTRPLGGVKIPKKWKWEGEAFVKREADKAESFARIIISDAMEPREKGMRLNILFKTTEGERPLDSVKFEKLMSRAQMSKFFRPACQRPSHFARLSGSEHQDKKALDALVRHMTALDLGSYAFMENSDGQPEALLLLIPSQRCIGWGFVKTGPDGKQMPMISEELRQGPFFVAVCSWNLSGEKILTYGMRPTGHELKRVLNLREQIAPPDPVAKSTGLTLRVNPALERSRRIINPPQQLLNFLADQNYPHPFAVWSYPSDSVAKSQKVGVETTMLRDVIRAAHGQEVGLESDKLRVLFVHVGSIKTLSAVPNILERRKQQLVQIFTYGTHHTVPSTQWGIREIYVYGGCVTFGPGLIKDAYGAVRRIAEMADEHPMWTAFITPSALALAAYEIYGENPVQVFDEHPEQFPHRKLLQLITSGRLSILRKPPTRVASIEDYKEKDEWITWHRDIVFRGERGVLEECLRWFNTRYEREFERRNVDSAPAEEELRRFVLEELQTTVNAVMIQPAMLESARRSVVVLGEGEHVVNTDKCGFEWETLSRFSFGDDFWREEDMAEMRRRLR